MHWYIAIIGVTLALITIYFLRKSVPNFTGELKRSMRVVLVGAMLGIIPPIILVFYGILGKELDTIFWQTSITLYVVVSIYLVFSMSRLEKFLTSLRNTK